MGKLLAGGAAWAADPLHLVLHDELSAQLDLALATLSESLSAVVLLRDVDGLSTEATAARLGISPGAVKVRLHRARLHLRAALAPYLALPEGVERAGGCH